MAARGVFASPTGARADGSVCFTEEDLMTAGGVSLRRMPAGDIVLELVPSAATGSTDIYIGANTPIKCSVDAHGRRTFRCMHVTTEANDKKGEPAILCTAVWEASIKVTVGTMRSHCRKGHWRVKKTMKQVAGQRTLSWAAGSSSSRPKKKRQLEPTPESSEAVAAAAAVMPHKQVGEEGTDVTNVDARVESGGANVGKTAEDDDVEMEVDGGNQGDIGAPPTEVDIEYIACGGINYADISKVKFPEGFDFMKDYPLAIHSKATQASYAGSNLIPKVSWAVDSDGNLKADKCKSIIIRDRNDKIAVAATTTKAGESACEECVSLQFNQPLLRVLDNAAKKEYGGSLPNVLCPASLVAFRAGQLQEQIDGLRLQRCNNERKISSLTRRVDDHSRLILMIQEMDIPALKRLALAHFRNGNSLPTFIEKCTRAAEHKMVGHATLQRTYLQRGHIRDGALDIETYKCLLMTILTNKLGCTKLVHTNSFVHGGMSHRQMRRHVNQKDTVPNFKLALTSSINEQGLGAIEKNMVDLFLNERFVSFLPRRKCLVHLLIDGVATDERLGLDDSQLPHQVTGLCRHCTDATFNTYADALRIQEGLDNGTIHLAKEAEMLCLAINDGVFTSLIPLGISPTCKKDDVLEESTSAIKELVSTITAKWRKLPISKEYHLSTVNSDGAPQFRKGVGQVLNKDLPPKMRTVYVADDGSHRCPLLNLVAGNGGTTASCDNDHLGKRFRARIKADCGIAIGVDIFTKVDLSHLMGMVHIVDSADEAHRLFYPEDLMDVLETVKCLHKVGKLSTVTFMEFPDDWRAVVENKHVFREMRLLGLVSKLMCISIVGHGGDVEEEGDHLSIGGYLEVLSTLAHVLFFLYRKHKTEFIPAQNYRNWQEMIKNMFLSVTMAKVNGVEHFYWFLNTNKKIEENFGIMRSMRGGDLNFDCLGLRNRAADASLVQWIYAQYPEWDTLARRLKSSADRKNPRSWKGDTRVAIVNEVECWEKGRNKALEKLRASKVFTDEDLDIDAIIAAEPGVDMFRPYCRRVGVLAGDRAEYTLADLEGEQDDEYEEDN